MIAKRITAILKHYQLTAQSFADKIGMQRSTLSHIFLGRNKPSLDMLTKISSAFPEVSMDYIITGEGELMKPSKAPSLFSESSDTQGVEINSSKANEGVTNVESRFVTNVTNELNPSPTVQLVKIIELYSDGSFKEYTK